MASRQSPAPGAECRVGSVLPWLPLWRGAANTGATLSQNPPLLPLGLGLLTLYYAAFLSPHLKKAACQENSVLGKLPYTH